MEYLWGSGLFSTSDFAPFFSCTFVPSELQFTILFLHDKSCAYYCYYSLRFMITSVSVKQAYTLGMPRKHTDNSFCGLRDERTTTLVSLSTYAIHGYSKRSAIDNTYSNNYYEMRRRVYKILHNKSCACYTNV